MSAPIHVRLELHAEGDSLSGRAISDHQSREFHGWMGLMGAVDALMELAADNDIQEAGTR